MSDEPDNSLKQPSDGVGKSVSFEHSHSYKSSSRLPSVQGQNPLTSKLKPPSTFGGKQDDGKTGSTNKPELNSKEYKLGARNSKADSEPKPDITEDMFKIATEMSDIKDADKRYPYKVNFGRFLARKMKGQHNNSTNEIVTSRYTKANWFPLALFAQLKKPVIIYFFIITVLSCLPFSGQSPTMLIITLVVVILFSMVRELFEDLKR